MYKRQDRERLLLDPRFFLLRDSPDLVDPEEDPDLDPDVLLLLLDGDEDEDEDEDEDLSWEPLVGGSNFSSGKLVIFSQD